MVKFPVCRYTTAIYRKTVILKKNIYIKTLIQSSIKSPVTNKDVRVLWGEKFKPLKVQDRILVNSPGASPLVLNQSLPYISVGKVKFEKQLRV